ncbi:MAG: zf-HC2 domain-containing protein [Thermoleophilaceae bacterium]|nr:zf-HC2 domain-containing protein [Thermoleophilaceae bacterium]
MIRRLLERRRYMREHNWTHAHLSEYLDQDLSPAERERVEEHVSICPHCRRVLRTLRRTLESLMDLHGEPRPGLADGVIDRLRGEP